MACDKQRVKQRKQGKSADGSGTAFYRGVDKGSFKKDSLDSQIYFVWRVGV